MAFGLLLSAVDIPFTASCLMPDNGLASLAASLLAAGHRVEVLDPGTVSTMATVSPEGRAVLRAALAATRHAPPGPAVQQALAAARQVMDEARQRLYARLGERLDERIARESIDFLGIKLWFGAAAADCMAMAARLVQRHPRLKLFAGGPVPTLVPEWTLATWPCLSAVCVGDGEEAVVGLAEHAAGRRALAEVPNLVYREAGELRRTARSFVALEELPDPVYDPEIYPALAGCEKLPILSIDESRGCPMRCPFCVHRELSGGRWRKQRPERIVELAVRVHRSLGVRALRFSGSLTPSGLLRRIATGIAARVPGMLLSGFSHVNEARPEDFPALQAAGVVALFFGVESGAPELLGGSLGKRTSPERSAAVLGAALDANIFTSASIIFPAPGETASTMAQTFDLLARTCCGRPNASVVVQPAFPLPGSLWWREMERHGFGGDGEALLRALATRPPYRLMPQEAGGATPLTLDGVAFSELCRRALALEESLRSLGIATGLTDEAVLIARAAGQPPARFGMLNHEIFATADAEGAGQLIRNTLKQQ